jgi:hypothetical protein
MRKIIIILITAILGFANTSCKAGIMAIREGAEIAARSADDAARLAEREAGAAARLAEREAGAAARLAENGADDAARLRQIIADDLARIYPQNCIGSNNREICFAAYEAALKYYQLEGNQASVEQAIQDAITAAREKNQELGEVIPDTVVMVAATAMAGVAYQTYQAQATKPG